MAGRSEDTHLIRMTALKSRPSPVTVAAIFYALVWLVIIAYYFPYRYDRPETIHFQPAPEQQSFYDSSFETSDSRYAQVAREFAEATQIRRRIEIFVSENHLSKARVLEIGSGEGLLQDVVEDYTGLDISATARAKYHKPFVQADARVMPFPDNSFDAGWSIWVLEHVPNPEQALREIRRVLKPDGLLYLAPAWMCSELAANGYGARPYSDFGLLGKATKLSIPIQKSPLFMNLYLVPSRMIRQVGARLQDGPSRLHYRPLQPNYTQYWEPDSDAVNSLDPYEVGLWFRTRGDECLNCPPGARMIWIGNQPLMIRIRKP